MALSNALIYSLNAGEISRFALARVDLAKMRLAASQAVNWMLKVVGPMQFRGGTLYKTGTNGNGIARLVPFIFSADDTAQLELTDSTLRPLIAGVPISRASVATAITNGSFTAGAGWTLAASAGASATIAGGFLTLDTIVRGSTATARQQVTVAVGDRNVEHAVRIIVTRGPILLRVGTASGLDDYIAETTLQDGTHSLAFTPTGNFWIQFAGNGAAARQIDQAIIESPGIVTLPTPWAASILRSLRYDQSGDIIYVCHKTTYPRRIERRGARSWSIVRHDLNDGPFAAVRSALVKLTPGATEGITTLTSDLPFFSANQVGALFSLYHGGTNQTVSIGADNTWSPVIRVSGVNDSNENRISRTITGVWVGSIIVQRSVDGPDSGFSDLQPSATTINIAGATLDPPNTLNNVILYYRTGFKPGSYTSGFATLNLAAGVNAGDAGGGTGTCRVLAYIDSTHVTVEVIKPFYHTNASDDWQEGIWSDKKGWPSSVALHEGRWWAGNLDKVSGSESDAFNSFDPTTVGDAGPIVRSIASGPVNRAIWMLSLGRLVVGTSGSEAVPRSNSFDEPMTPVNFSIKDVSTQGSADVQAVKIDRNGAFVQRSGRRLYELAFDAQAMDYVSSDLTRFHPEIASPGIVELAAQRQPDTRIWAVRSDGQCAILLYAKAEDVTGWSRFVTDGIVESVCVTPNTLQDDVWLCIKRTVGGVDKYLIERVSYDANAAGGAVNEMADAAVIFGAVPSGILSGLGHLEGRSVVVWADGVPLDGTFTVASGSINIGRAVVTGAVAGLTYTGTWVSTKLAYASDMGTAIGQTKRLPQISPIMVDTHWRGPRFGSTLTGTMDPVPATIDGRRFAHDEVVDQYDSIAFPLSGNWTTDSRLCVQVQAPFPCTILAFVVQVSTHDKS